MPVARRWLLVAPLLLATAAHADPPNKDDPDPEPKLSLPTEADREAWTRTGFRLGLGFVYGELSGANGAPSGKLYGAQLRAGLRLDETWSILASFQYARAHRAHELDGLRFAGTLDPTYHPAKNLAIAVGFGFGGIVEGSTDRADPDPKSSTLDTSYTFPDAHTPVASCSGVGVVGLVRGEWSYVLGPRASTSLGLEVSAQWTGCVDDTGRVEPDSGTSIVRRQFWAHTGTTLTWSVMWR